MLCQCSASHADPKLYSACFQIHSKFIRKALLTSWPRLGKTKDRKDKLNAKLSWGEPISPSDEEWLDHEGNTVDEEHILETLNLAPDYEGAVAEFDNHGT